MTTRHAIFLAAGIVGGIVAGKMLLGLFSASKVALEDDEP